MDLLLGLALLDGLAYAALVFMVAVGLTLVFGVMRVLNVAHGSFFAIGGYLAASIGIFIAAQKLPPALAFAGLVLAAALVGFMLGSLVESLLLARIYAKEQVLQLLVTFALFMILEDVQKLVWGVQPIFASTPLKLLPNVSVLGVSYTSYQVILLPAVALLTVLGLRYFLRHTLAGAVILAASG